MATAWAAYILGQGTPTVVQPTLQLIGIGAAGDPGALRIMGHPDTINFPPITYYKNPDVTVNIDNELLRAPITTPVTTLNTTQIVRFERGDDDVIITEIWEAARGASMPTFLFRQLYEYLINPPDFDPQAQTYITWQPRDRNTKSYDIQLYEMRVDGGEGAQSFKMREIRLPASTNVKHPLETMDVTPTGLVQGDVQVSFRIVQETP